MREFRHDAKDMDRVDLTQKHKDPNYAVVRGSVPKELAFKFKSFCLEQGFDYSEGLEQVLTDFFKNREQKKPSPDDKQKKH